MTAVLETARLRMLPLTLADEAALFEVFADADARTVYPDMAAPEKIRGWIEWNLRNYQQFGFGLWAIELKSTGQLIGDCGLTYQQVEGSPELEIGYHVHHSHRRQGYALEAARACLGFGFRHTRCEMICSLVRPWNTASSAVATRLHTDCREILHRDKPLLVFSTARPAWELSYTDLECKPGQ